MKKEIAINKRIIIFTQVFWLIFFAELGDKTQISTILMANNKQVVLGKNSILKIIEIK